MTYIFYIFTITIITPILLLAYLYPRKLFLIVPVIFAIAFSFTWQVPSYEGYAISDEFVSENSEGVILSVTEGKTHWFVLLSFFDEKEPRLVKIERSPETDEKMKKNDGKTTKILRFSKKRGNGPNGDGQGGDAGAFEILNLNQSEKLRKEG